jgi:ribonuclease HII
MVDFSIEKEIQNQGYRRVAGVDEVGRGAWAGPVFAAAVIFSNTKLSSKIYSEINDSKKLSSKKRDSLYEIIIREAEVGIGQASVEDIDNMNILNAAFLAMERAISDLKNKADFIIIDGNQSRPVFDPSRPVIKGDTMSLSIAAASIVAKVSRDRLMIRLDSKFEGYSWNQNKGYGTISHKTGLNKLGITIHHRKTFKPIINILSSD